MANIPISEINFRCDRCKKTYFGSTNGGLVSDEDTWTCPSCLTPQEQVKAKAQTEMYKSENLIGLNANTGHTIERMIADEPKDAKYNDMTPGNVGFKKLVLDLLPKAHYFMVAPEAVFTLAGGARPELDLDVAPPFETCWFQFPEPSAGFTGFKTSGDEVVYGMFIHEVSPQRYCFALVLKDHVDPNLLRLRGGFASENDDHDIWHTVAFWLQPFANGMKTGIEKVNERFKYKSDGEKKLLKIKKVVYVYPKKMTKEQSDDAEKRHIDFSHRWEVRAHWRTLAPGKVGKNRAGEYCVAGKTFVMESVKGPEHLPLIKKTRVVLDPKKC